MNPLFNTDFYKYSHREQYPEGTEIIYSNFTARSANHFDGYDHDGKYLFFGAQAVILKMYDEWKRNFFDRDLGEVVREYEKIRMISLGEKYVDLEHIKDLHKLGYLPIEIKTLPEGSYVNIGIPCLTIRNTDRRFFWLTNFLETYISSNLWKITTVSTISFLFKKLATKFASATCDNLLHIPYQCHDFSFRGMSGSEDAGFSGMGHLVNFTGTDTIPAIYNMDKYYQSGYTCGASVPATEHSVMSLSGKDGEFDLFKRLITETHPSGIISIVSDTYDFWRVIEDYAKKLKPEIEAREGKVVFRPDSGDPVEIICGSKDQVTKDGALYKLLEIFGGKKNSKGFMEINPRVGLIYGDSITYSIMNKILTNMRKAEYASNNIVFGIGSYTYQFITRDTLGFAMKATYGEVNGQGYEIFKDPITDKNKVKKSAKGLLQVYKEGYNFKLREGVSIKESREGSLSTKFINGKFPMTFDDYRSITKRINLRLKDVI